MITVDRLQQIIPADQALANKALSVSLQQITGIKNLSLPTFANTVSQVQTTRDLPIISALTEAVPASVANYYTTNLAVGTGPNDTIRIVDVLGLAAGWIATDAYTETVILYSQMDLTALTLIYQTMYNASTGVYGNTTAGPLVIPGGYPCAGTYNGTEIPPTPPATDPTYDPTSLSLAMLCLTGAAGTEIARLQAAYPTQTTELNNLSNSMAQQVIREDSLQALIQLNYANLTANDRNAIYGFLYSLPSYGSQTEVGGVAWFIENMADLSTQAGEAIVATLRQGRNQQALNKAGIYTNTKIPSEPDPPPEQASLLPSEYSAAEAANLAIK
jgi:hypothetical protein